MIPVLFHITFSVMEVDNKEYFLDQKHTHTQKGIYNL